MLYMVTVWFPPDKAAEVKQRIEDLPARPSYLKLINQYLLADGERGIKIYHLYQVEQEKADAGLQALFGRLALFGTMPGYTWCIEPLISADDAMQLM